MQARGRRLRAISLGIQSIAIIGIAVLAAIIAGSYIITQTRAIASKGATVSLVIDAHDAGGGYTTVVVNVKNNGPEGVSISSVKLYVNGVEKSCSWTPSLPITQVKPGASISLSTVCYTNANVGDKVTIVIEGTTLQSGTRYSVSGSTEIQP